MSLYFMSIRPDAFVGMPFSASSIVSTCVPVIAKPISECISPAVPKSALPGNHSPRHQTCKSLMDR